MRVILVFLLCLIGVSSSTQIPATDLSTKSLEILQQMVELSTFLQESAGGLKSDESLLPDFPPIGSPGDMPKPVEVRELSAAAAPAPAPYLPAFAADTALHDCKECQEKMKQAGIAFSELSRTSGKPPRRTLVDSVFKNKVINVLCLGKASGVANCEAPMIADAKTIVQQELTAMRSKRLKVFDSQTVARGVCETMNRCRAATPNNAHGKGMQEGEPLDKKVEEAEEATKTAEKQLPTPQQ